MNPLETTVLPDASRATQVAAFAGASSTSNAPFTSGITPTTTLLPATMSAQGYGAMPTVALMGAIGAAAILANF
jgi:transforming growth factor-beta-induced protein